MEGMTMQVAAIFGPRQGGLVEVPDPQPKDDIVVVKIHSAPMCTEFKGFRDGHPTQVLGHEAAGEVAAVDKATRVRVGDRVVVQPQHPCGKCALCERGHYIHCQHSRDVLAETGSAAGTATYAQYLLKSEGLLTPIPDGMSYDQAAMACCGLGPTFGAMQLMSVDAFDTVLITGLGPVGLGGVINARYRGARVIGVEGHPYRAELARQLGAAAVINPEAPDAVPQVLDLTAGLGADKSIETSGTAPAKPFLMEATRRQGQIAFVGWEGQVDAGTIILKGLTIHGAWHYNLYDAGRLMQVIAASGAQLDRLITHRFPMTRVQDAWELQLTGNCGKVILDPWA
jgi:threonine dehydrogenase-like Zn-dependent dehydrogenase